MARVYGNSSEYLHKKWRETFRRGNVLVAGLLIAYFLFVYSTQRLEENLIVMFFCFALYVAFAKFVDNSTTTIQLMLDRITRGQNGEHIVCTTLAQLPDTYTVFRGLNLTGKSDIDFVVTGPTGIFAIEAKSHAGQVGYDGSKLTLNGRPFQEKDILRQARGGAMHLHNFLKDKTGRKFFVNPAIIFSSQRARMSFGMKRVANVYIINNHWTTALLTRQDYAALDTEQINQMLTEHYHQPDTTSTQSASA